ncbi:hypothetical protein BCR42DRAFT_46372 [Absidia repens]|uniref:Uncharacterized protein n=1 Tax=Absidia repens TaxID=90262 RepID=A0A1X2IFQ9_9FUNG|nr:hypothetical protein BCR42DRAFT_46372 [Absidia repens]
MDYQPGDITIGLDRMEAYMKNLVGRVRGVELIWLLYTELLACKYGYSSEVVDASLQGAKEHPFSVYIHWQIIRSVPHYYARQEMVAELLKTISAAPKDKRYTGTSESASILTVRTLLCVLKNDGLYAVLEFLLPADSVHQIIDFHKQKSNTELSISIKSRPSYIHMTNHDLCYMWMCVVVFYVCHQLPIQTYNQHWRNELTPLGTIQMAGNPLIGIHWGSIKKFSLTAQQEIVVCTLLTSMLTYFAEQASTRPSAKRLMATVWRTLVDFLDHSNSYGHERLAQQLYELRGQGLFDNNINTVDYFYLDAFYEINLDMEMNAVPLWKRITQTLPENSRSRMTDDERLNSFIILSYHAGLYTLRHHKSSPSDSSRDPLTVACRFSEYLALLYEHRVGYRLRQLRFSKDNTRRLSKQLTSLVDLHTTALGMKTSTSKSQPPPDFCSPDFDCANLRKNPFAWINALAVTMLTCIVTKDITTLVEVLVEATSRNVTTALTANGQSLLNLVVIDYYTFLEICYNFPSTEFFFQTLA